MLRNMLVDVANAGLYSPSIVDHLSERQKAVIDIITSKHILDNYILIPISCARPNDTTEKEWVLTSQHEWEVNSFGDLDDSAFRIIDKNGNIKHHGYICKKCGQHLAHDWNPEISLHEHSCIPHLICPICGRDHPDDSDVKFCAFCGTRLIGIRSQEV